MKRVVCVVALGLSLGACETYPGYDGYGYYDRPGGRFEREQQCYEVRNSLSRPYVECRYAKRWKPTYSDHHHNKRRWRDRDEDDDYSYREAKRRWRDKEYYD